MRGSAPARAKRTLQVGGIGFGQRSPKLQCLSRSGQIGRAGGQGPQRPFEYPLVPFVPLVPFGAPLPDERMRRVRTVM